MSKQILSEEFRRMQKLAGITNEVKLYQGDKSGAVYAISVSKDRGGDEYGNIEIYESKNIREVVQEKFNEAVNLIKGGAEDDPDELESALEYIEEFVDVLEYDSNTYSIGYNEDESYLVGTLQSPIYGKFWELLLNDNYEEAEDYFYTIDTNEINVTDEFENN
jgi:hypothetical protein